MTAFLDKHKKMTTFDLKVIGLILMVLDHVHEIFSGAGVPFWFDWFGRPVATIFFFVSVEGFTHTRNKKKYLWRLLIGFWIMGIGDAIIQQFFSVSNVSLMNNIFADLFIGVSAMYGIEKVKTAFSKHSFKDGLIGTILLVSPILMSIYIQYALQVPGIIQISGLAAGFIYPATVTAENSFFCYLAVFLYLAKDNRMLQCIFIAITAFLYTGYTSGNQFNNLFTVNTQWMMILAIIPIIFYNGQRGRSMKSFFYVFYPGHIWFLYILASLLGIK
ncbi:conjugal transfer protein TraX [Ligilactobacillus sp. WILCCON 0076]|uniref:Conjugal transfer protein TraX n=1 Tax=Ligilactobacillus ubinensis TaxID=2876789 RepID=A0A9X2FKP2_9LACO|nr:TraX family protein [Ligilactobacillus ubinensis]MCP0887050.1 conjugal transfer protein TraX [Ligilactobacillus ubinensis]